MNNPYNAPSADLSQPVDDVATYKAAFFAVSGRLGRARYVAYVTGAMILATIGMVAVVTLIVMTVGRTSSLMMFLPLLTSICAMGAWSFFAIRRLNDMGRTGWLALLGLVPIANLGLGLWLMFGRGDGDTNRYGPPPCENGAGVIATCVAAVVAMIGLIIFAPIGR